MYKIKILQQALVTAVVITNSSLIQGATNYPTGELMDLKDTWIIHGC